MKRLIAVTLLLLTVVGCATDKQAENRQALATKKANADVVDADGSLARVRKSGALRVGADLQAGLPFWAPGHNAGDPLNGFEAGLADMLAEQLGAKAKVVPTKWSELLAGLDAGLYDIVLNAVEVPTAETRKKWPDLAFSKPYLKGGEWIVVPPEDKTTERLADLKDMQVGVIKAGVDGALLEAANKQHKLGIKVVGQKSPKNLFKQLETRAIDAALLPQPMAALFLVQNPTFRAAGMPIMEKGYVIAVKRDDKALLNAIDAWLGKIDSDRAYGSLAKKWKMVPGE
jgi:polar amino acid transport system substrate-binding protein